MIPDSRALSKAFRKPFWLLAIALAVLVFLLSGSRAVQAEGTLPWDQYWSLVEETAQKINQAENGPPDQAQAELKAMAARWKEVTHVGLPDGGVLIVEPGLLVNELQALHPDWDHLHALLAQMKASQARESLSSFTAQDAQAVQAILARPEYQWTDEAQNAIQRFLMELWQKIVDFLSQFIPQNGVNVPVDARPLFALGIFLALLLVLYFSFRGIFHELVGEASLAQDDSAEENLSAAQAMQRAQEFAQSGDHRLAVRYLYLSGLLLLEERGLLRYDRSRTNREYLRSVQEHPQLALNLREVIEVFDRVWYGYHEIDEESYAQYVEQVNRLKEQK